jgi:hypothetical protein
MSIKLFSTAPTRSDVFWQIVLLPTVTVLRNREFNTSYTVASIEWLFWSVTIIINDN